MALPALDITRNWSFQFASLVTNKIPVTMEDNAGVITFSVPLDPYREIRIELFTQDEEEQIIAGKYTVGPLGNTETVIFKILESGLVGQPEGSLAREKWKLTST